MLLEHAAWAATNITEKYLAFAWVSGCSALVEHFMLVSHQTEIVLEICATVNPMTSQTEINY